MGKYWRNSPFVFSFDPRCHGLCGSEHATDAALLHAERIRPWIVVGIDIVAAALAVMSPVAMLVLWTASLIFLAATSNGLEHIRR